MNVGRHSDAGILNLDIIKSAKEMPGYKTEARMVSYIKPQVLVEDKMTKRTKLISLVAIGVIVIMFLFPPWLYPVSGKGTFPGGYAFIFTGPKNPYSAKRGWRIDTTKISVQIMMVCLIAGGLIIVKFKPKD
jgi:hypothetical protein